MNQDVNVSSYDANILDETCNYFIELDILKKFETYVNQLRPLYACSLEKFFYSLLHNCVYGKFSNQIPFLNTFIDILVKFIYPKDELLDENNLYKLSNTVVDLLVKCLIKDGLIPCFINSILVTHRLNQIHQNFNHMGIETTWLKNLDIWNFIYEKDYWFNSDYTSNKTSSSLQVAVGGKPASFADEAVIQRNLVVKRKAQGRQASHDYASILPAEEDLKWLQSTSEQPNEDLLSSFEESPTYKRDSIMKISSRTNACLSPPCFNCKHISLKESKEKQAFLNKKKLSKIGYNAGKCAKRGKRKLHSNVTLHKHSSRNHSLHSLDKKMELRDAYTEPENEINSNVLEDKIIMDKIEDKKFLESDKPVPDLNIFIKQERIEADNEKETADKMSSFEIMVSKDNSVVNKKLLSDENVTKKLSQIKESENDENLWIVKRNEEEDSKLKNELDDTVKEDESFATKYPSNQTVILEYQSKKNDGIKLSTPNLSLESNNSAALSHHVDVLFDIFDKIKLLPYANNNSEMESIVEKLLDPILTERNQLEVNSHPENSVNSVGLQTVNYSPDKKREFDNCSMDSANLDIICSLLKKCSFLERNLNNIQKNALHASDDCRKFPIRRKHRFSESHSSDIKSLSTISNIFICNSSHYFDKVRNLKRRQIHPRRCKVTHPHKKHHKTSHKKCKKPSHHTYHKYMKKSVIADFLCLPFAHAIRNMIYKVLIEKNLESNFEDKCHCIRHSASSNLKRFDSSYEEYNNCSARMIDNIKFVPCKKKMHKRRYPSAGGMNNIAEKSKKDQWTIYTHSFDTISYKGTCSDKEFWSAEKNYSSSSRCFSNQCLNERQCVECNVLHDTMRKSNKLSTNSIFRKGNRTCRYYLDEECKRNESRHFSSDSFVKSDRLERSHRDIRSSSQCQSRVITNKRCNCCSKENPSRFKLNYKKMHYCISD